MFVVFPAFAGTDITPVQYSIALDMIWILLCAALVFFMQAGFAMLETGLTRAKNASNIIMKNLVDFSMGAIMFWLIGWGLMYGKSSFFGAFGSDGFLLHYLPERLSEIGGTAVLYRDWFFQVVFACTAATIVSGALAERAKFSAYIIFSIFMTSIIYPIAGHWIWGGGWLQAMGFHDFAGSTTVHSVGGWAALIGAWILGPREGKYISNKSGTTVLSIPGHNMPLAALGVFVLWFGWYGFNAGSTLSGTDLDVALVFLNTTLAAAAGIVGSLFLTWKFFGKPDPSFSLNGALAGLVAVTAGCYVFSPLAALFTGLLAGIFVVLAAEFIDKKLHIDDPVGAISVHGLCGAWGTLAVGLFGDAERLPLDKISQIAVQSLGIFSIFAWVTVLSIICFGLLKLAKFLRCSRQDEMMGLDRSEHGIDSYSGFEIFYNM